MSNGNRLTLIDLHFFLKNRVFKIDLNKLDFGSTSRKLLKFEGEGQEFAKIMRSLKQFIQTVKGQNNYW